MRDRLDLREDQALLVQFVTEHLEGHRAELRQLRAGGDLLTLDFDRYAGSCSGCTTAPSRSPPTASVPSTAPRNASGRPAGGWPTPCSRTTNFRHFLATRCIESGVDIPTVSRWLGHKDGGALAMRIYGHLRQKHSFAAIKKVGF